MSVPFTPPDVHYYMGQGGWETRVPDTDLGVGCHTMKYTDLSSVFLTSRKGHHKDWTLVIIVVVIV